MDYAETTTGAETTGEKASRGKLVEDLKAVAADMEELLKATASQTGERISAARVKAEESLKAARVRLADEGKAAFARAKTAAKTTDEYVHAHPWGAVGIGAAAGFILGLLISRR